MSDLLRTLLRARQRRLSFRAANKVGEGTRIDGLIERRSPKASIVIGRNCLIQGQLVAERDESRIEIADGVLVGATTIIDCALSVTIEGGVLISYGCTLADADNHSIYPELRANDLTTWMDGQRHDWSHTQMAPIIIKENAWIGARSIILKGVTIGSGAVVGMGSVVTADVPPRMVVAGNPARIIREIGPPPDIRRG